MPTSSRNVGSGKRSRPATTVSGSPTTGSQASRSDQVPQRRKQSRGPRRAVDAAQPAHAAADAPIDDRSKDVADARDRKNEPWRVAGQQQPDQHRFGLHRQQRRRNQCREKQAGIGRDRRCNPTEIA